MSGSGYIPGESLEIWLLSDPVLLKTIVADGTGAFTTTVSIPAATLAGAHHLEVRGTSSATVSRAINIRAGLANTGSEHGMALTLALLLTAAGTALVVRQHRSA